MLQISCLKQEQQVCENSLAILSWIPRVRIKNTFGSCEDYVAQRLEAMCIQRPKHSKRNAWCLSTYFCHAYEGRLLKWSLKNMTSWFLVRVSPKLETNHRCGQSHEQNVISEQQQWSCRKNNVTLGSCIYQTS